MARFQLRWEMKGAQIIITRPRFISKTLICRPDFEANVLARKFPALSEERSMQVGGPKVRLAGMPTGP
jgi:hypothetical protein